VQNDERFTLKQFVSMIQQTEGKEIHVDFGGKPYKAREVMIPMEHYKKLPNWETKIKAKSMFTLINDRGGVKSPNLFFTSSYDKVFAA
jgi:hypothetical protein